MSSRAVLFAVLLLVAGCKRQEPVDCEQPPSATGCTFDAECELVTGGCCGEVQVPAPARKTDRAQVWVEQCGSKPPCPSECPAAKPLVAHCVKGTCLAVERRAEPVKPAPVVAVDAAVLDAGAPLLDAGAGLQVLVVDAGAPPAPLPQGAPDCAKPPSPPSCQQDADCDVVSATVACCEERFFPVGAAATVPVRAWAHACFKPKTCERPCELPDVHGGRCVKGVCAAVVTRQRSALEKRPWDTKTPRRGVITAGKPEPLGPKPLPAAFQKWLKAKVPAIEACFTKALQGQPVGAPATRVIKLAADSRGLTVLGVEGTEPLDELAAGCPQMVLEDLKRPAGLAPRTRVELSWALTFTGVAAKGRR